jgi:hypothetical protein
MTGKHFNNTTLIQMDKNGDYQLVHGPPYFQFHCNISTKIIAWITPFYSDCVNA